MTNKEKKIAGGENDMNKDKTELAIVYGKVTG